MMGNLIKVAIERPVTTAVLMIAVLILGVYVGRNIPMDMFPDLKFPVAVIMTDYEGSGPQEIEETITKPIERSIGTVDNIKNINSTSRDGSSIVTVEFSWGVDIMNATADLREKVEMVQDIFPDEASKPLIFRFDIGMMPIMRLGLTGSDDLAYLKNIAQDKVADQLEKIEGVAAANVVGGLEEAIRIDINRNRMEAYGLDIMRLVNTLRAENLNTPTGDVKDGKNIYSVKVNAKFQDLNEIRNVVASVKEGRIIRLRDIAHVHRGYREQREVVHLNGEDGISVIIQKQSGANTVQTVRRINKKMEQIQKDLPAEIKIHHFFDQAEFIIKSLTNVASVALLGGILTIVVLFFFLRSLRSVLIIGLSIPTSIIVTFIALYLRGITLNMISLSGLALGIGMMVDSSIVVLENIFTFRERGSKSREAALLGTKEVVMAIFASTLTTIMVFLPLFLTESNMAIELFREMAWAVLFVLLASLLVSITVIPMLAAKFLKNQAALPAVNGTDPAAGTGRTDLQKRGRGVYRLVAWMEGALQALDERYSRLVRLAVNNKTGVILIVLGSLMVSLVLFFTVVGKEFMPEQDEGRFKFSMKLPLGTNLDTTSRYAFQVEKFLQKNIPEIRIVYMQLGSPSNTFVRMTSDSGDHVASFSVRLLDLSERQRRGMRGVKEITEYLRQQFRASAGVAGTPGAEFNFDSGGGFNAMMGGGSPVEIEIRGPDLDAGQRLAEQVLQIVRSTKGTRNAKLSRETGLPEQHIIINRRKAASFGISSYQVSRILNNYVNGVTATTFSTGAQEIDIFVRLRSRDRANLADLKKLKIPSPMGFLVPVGNFADIRETKGPAQIERKNQERIIKVQSAIFGTSPDKVVAAIKERVEKLLLPKHFSIAYGGSYKDMQESFGKLAVALLLAVMLVYAIMAAQFESLLDPFIIIFSVPLSFIGVALIHLATFTTFSVVSAIGQLMLAGIVVNNAIILVDYMNLLRKKGTALYEAAVQAGRRRLRPILMTTLTTVLGLVPMSLGLGEGGELTGPLARSMIGGLLTSTLLTLLFIPVLYVIFNKKHEERKKTSDLIHSVTH